MSDLDREPIFGPRPSETPQSGVRYVIASTIDFFGKDAKVYFSLHPFAHWSGPCEPVIAKTYKTRREAELVIERNDLCARATCWIETIDYNRKEKVIR
jgi:hypothetical protein